MSMEDFSDRKILFVDDEQQVLNSLKRELRKEPYQKLFANSPFEAIEILKMEKVHVIVSDMRMPQMTGLELLKLVKKEYPDVIRIVLSGYTQFSTILSAINSGDIFRYITKPWKFEEDFLPTIRQAILMYNDNEKVKERINDFENRLKKCEKREESLVLQLRNTNLISANLVNFLDSFRNYFEKTFSAQNILEKNELRTLHKFSNLLSRAKTDVLQEEIEVNTILEMLYYKLKSRLDEKIIFEISENKKIIVFSSKHLIYFILEDFLDRLILSEKVSKIRIEIGHQDLDSEIAIIFSLKDIKRDFDDFYESLGLHYFKFMASLIKLNIDKKSAPGRGIVLIKFNNKVE